MPTKIIFDPFNIVFSKIGPGLHLNKNNGSRSDIFNPMQCSLGDIDGFPSGKWYLFRIPGDHGLAGKDIPMFFPELMSLETQSFPGIDGNPFDLMIGFIGQNLIISPGTVVFFHINFSLNHSFLTLLQYLKIKDSIFFRSSPGRKMKLLLKKPYF
jgi:hypothetical protein